MRAVSAVVDRRRADWVVAQERPSISHHNGSSCCTDVRYGSCAVAVDAASRRQDRGNFSAWFLLDRTSDRWVRRN